MNPHWQRGNYAARAAGSQRSTVATAPVSDPVAAATRISRWDATARADQWCVTCLIHRAEHGAYHCPVCQEAS